MTRNCTTPAPKRNRLRRLALAASMSAALLIPAWVCEGHETDQYTLPRDKPMADLGDWLDAVHTLALERAIESTNASIASALRQRDPKRRAERLAVLHDPERITRAVNAQFNDAFTEVIEVEDAVRGDWARRSHPEEYTANWTPDWIYTYTHLPIDPRRLILLFQSSTIKAYGVYFGTDKLSHFHHMGMFYYDSYRAALKAGKTPEEALPAVISEYSDSGLIGENSLLGYVPTGVYSNGDLIANYMGFKFYLNVTEPVRLKGVMTEPLVVLVGPYWRLNRHVRPESGWFGAFVSDHWNEALNPSIYSDRYIAENVKGLMKKRSADIMAFYTQIDKRPADAAYYDRLAQELKVYYGEPYGHVGDDAELLTLGNTCIPELARREAATQAHPGTSPPP